MKITTVSDNGIKLIASFEGLRLKPYKCSAGVPTIGYGNTFYANGKKVSLTDPPISEQEAKDLLKYSLSKFAQYVDSFCRDDINQNQFDALVSLCYNIGPTNLKNSTLLKLVNENPKNPKIADQFLRWNKANGKILKGLTRRREAEIELYFKS